MITVTAKEMNYSINQLAEMVTWQGVIGWSGERCGDECGATTNVLIGPGWFCPCGHYNCQDFYGGPMPHANPTYGPSANKLRLGYKVAKLKENFKLRFGFSYFILA